MKPLDVDLLRASGALIVIPTRLPLWRRIVRRLAEILHRHY